MPPPTPPAPDAATRIPPQRPPDREIIFKKTAQGELKLYVYLSDNWRPQDRRPAILFFFGGGWRIGNASQFFSKAEYLAGRGIVALCAEYRIASIHNTSMKECVLDARSAFRYVHCHAAELGIDAHKIVAAGASSGGHLAASLPVLNGPNEEGEDIPCRPAALVLFNPVVNLGSPPPPDSTGPHLIWDRIAGATFEERAPQLLTLSPMEHLGEHYPRTIIFFGTTDKLLANARLFVTKSRALGNEVALWTAADVGHGFFNGEPWHTATLIKTGEFLAALGYLSGPPALQTSAVLVPDQ